MRFAYSLAMILAWCSVARSPPPFASLMPENTKGFLSSPDVQVSQVKWDQTEMGRLMGDPLMKPFRDDLRERLRNDDDPNRIQYGLVWDDVKDLTRGEAAIAMLHTPPKRPVRVILVDVTGNNPAAFDVLKKIFASLADKKKPATQRATTWKQDKVHGEKLTVFSLPKNSKDPSRASQVAFFIKENVLGAVEDEAVAKTIMGRLAGEKGASLESVPGYQAVMKRCQADAQKTEAGDPHARWYFNPVPYAEARRQLDPQFLKDGKVDLLRAMKNSGFQGVVAAGGFAHLGSGPYDVLNRAALFAPPPYEKTLAGLKTPNAPPVAPPAWIPATVASYTSGSAEMPLLMQHIAPLYDYTIGDGDGAWKDTLEGIRDDVNGPRVDLEKRLFAKLGVRGMRVTNVKEPIVPTSERTLIAVDLADAKEALSALQEFYANDKTAQKKKFGAYDYWEIWPEERKEGDIPSGVAVVRNQLLWTSNADMFQDFFQDISQEKQLAQDDGYRLVTAQVQAEAKKRSWDKLCIHRFVNSREAYRPTYELTRQDKLPLSASMLGSMLNMLMGQDSSGKPRKQEVDGSKLPDYAKVQHYVLPSGSLGVREDSQEFQGWFFLGFVLAKDGGKMAARKAE